VSIPLLFLCLRGRRTWFWRSSMSSLGSKLATCPQKWPAGDQNEKEEKGKINFLLKYNYEKMPILQNYLLSFFEYTLSPSLSRSPILAPLYRSNCVKITPWGLWSEKIKKVVALSVRTYLFFSYNKSIFFLRKNIVFMQKVWKSWKFFICSVGTHFSAICTW